jgi:hypothetical protein
MFTAALIFLIIVIFMQSIYMIDHQLMYESDADMFVGLFLILSSSAIILVSLILIVWVNRC